VATETIREFLVALSFKQDAASLKKFEDGINKATKAVVALATAIEATAVGVAAAVAKWSSGLEALYFAAQRTGTSATQLKALDQAAQNLGANAGDAQVAVEGLASALRTNPGNVGLLTGLLARLGYQLKVNADGTIDSVDALLKLSNVFKTMPYFQAQQFAQQLGITEKVLFQLTHGDLVGEYTKKLRELSRGGFDQAAEHAHQFMVDLRDLQTQLEVFAVKVEDAIQRKLGVSLKSITEWFDKNGDKLAERIADLAKQFIDGAQYIAEKIGYLVDKLREWDKETDGLSTKLLALAVLLKATGAGSIIGGVLGLAAAFGRLGIALGPVVAGMAALYGTWKALQSAQHDQNLSPGEVPGIVRFKEWVNQHLPAYARTPEGLLLNNPGNLEFRNQPGAAKVGRWAAFSSEGEGLFQLGRQLELYGNRGLNSVRAIISRFAPPGENNTAAYIANVASRLGVGADQSLNLNNPALLANMMNAITTHEQGYNPYSRDLVTREAQRAIAANVTQNNTVNINGATDPKATGEAVQGILKRNNAELTRNFAGAVQ
jgi:hypothetical protein